MSHGYRYQKLITNRKNHYYARSLLQERALCRYEPSSVLSRYGGRTFTQNEKARANHCNHIVIKLSSNSFFSEFGNIFKIGHWTKVRKKNLSDRKDITKKRLSEKQLRGLKWKNKPYKLKRFIHTCISIISRKKNRYIILPLWLIFSVVPRMIS